MSKENKKEKFFCIANCLPVKSKTAKNQKNGNKQPFRDDNDEPEGTSVEDAISVQGKMNHTRQWLQNLDMNAEFDPSGARENPRKAAGSLLGKAVKVKKASADKKPGSSNDSTTKPKLDSSLSSSCTLGRHENARPADESALTSASTSRHRHRRFRKSRRGLPSCPAEGDNVSIASSCVSLATEMITISLDASRSLGITIVGHYNAQQGDCGIFVGCVSKGGSAAESGKVEPGDLILEVNGIDLENLPNDTALNILRREVAKQGILTLVLAKYWELDDSRNDVVVTKYADMNDVAPYGPCSREGSLARGLPLDDERAMRRRRQLDDYNQCYDAYGARMDYFPRPSSSFLPQGPYYHPHPGYFPRPYSHVPPAYLDLGYSDVRKPQVPSYPFSNGDFMPRRPFLGSELIDWMQVNFPRMSARNEARSYAQFLLDAGYISSVERIFNENCWYARSSSQPLPKP